MECAATPSRRSGNRHASRNIRAKCMIHKDLDLQSGADGKWAKGQNAPFGEEKAPIRDLFSPRKPCAALLITS